MGNQESKSAAMDDKPETKANKELVEHVDSVNELVTANAIVIILFSILVSIVASIVYGLIYYHYSNRAETWIKITRTMHQRLSKQILREEKLKDLCQIIGVSAERIHADRKELCPDIEEMADLPVARSVDPFKAPSNLYEQIVENDDDAKTLKNIDPDVFIRKDDVHSSGASANQSGKVQGAATPGARSAEKAGNVPSNMPSTTPGSDGPKQSGSNEPPKPAEKKNGDKPQEVVHSVQA